MPWIECVMGCRMGAVQPAASAAQAFGTCLLFFDMHCAFCIVHCAFCIVHCAFCILRHCLLRRGLVGPSWSSASKHGTRAAASRTDSICHSDWWTRGGCRWRERCWEVYVDSPIAYWDWHRKCRRRRASR
jgi:hypothetical protein